jgi:hypothetical protein
MSFFKHLLRGWIGGGYAGHHGRRRYGHHGNYHGDGYGLASTQHKSVRNVVRVMPQRPTFVRNAVLCCKERPVPPVGKRYRQAPDSVRAADKR